MHKDLIQPALKKIPKWSKKVNDIWLACLHIRVSLDHFASFTRLCQYVSVWGISNGLILFQQMSKKRYIGFNAYLGAYGNRFFSLCIKSTAVIQQDLTPFFPIFISSWISSKLSSVCCLLTHCCSCIVFWRHIIVAVSVRLQELICHNVTNHNYGQRQPFVNSNHICSWGEPGKTPNLKLTGTHIYIYDFPRATMSIRKTQPQMEVITTTMVFYK